MISPDEVPEEIQAIITARITRRLNQQERDTLFEWIVSVRDQPGFQLKTLVMEGFGYDQPTYKRLNTSFSGWRKTRGVPASKGTKAPEIKIGDDAYKLFFADIGKIGKKIISEYYMNAATHGMSMEEYVTTAITTYEEYGDQIENMVQEMNSLRALSSILVESTQPIFTRLAAFRIYTEFINKLIQLRALGYEVNPTVQEHVASQLQILIRGQQNV